MKPSEYDKAGVSEAGAKWLEESKPVLVAFLAWVVMIVAAVW